MLTREEKKKLKTESKERHNPSLILLSSDGKEVAKMLYKGFDFPWCYGSLSPSEHFLEYSELFERVSQLRKLEESASDTGNNEFEQKYSDELRDLQDGISNMGFKILDSNGKEVKYITLNILGLEWEYK